MSLALRRRVLEGLCSTPDVVDELLLYNESPFAVDTAWPVFPLPEEAHVAVWREYAREASSRPLDVLRARLPQLAIPLREGTSRSPAYAAVMRRGQPFREADFGGRLELAAPDALRLFIAEHPAGALPVLATPIRSDFERLERALIFRSEPGPADPAVNARLVSGLVNWDRVERHRVVWGGELSAAERMARWPVEAQRVSSQESWRFNDRVVILCEGPYSGMTAADLGLPFGEAEWIERSSDLRLEHELTHYLTKRVFGQMRLNLLDEFLADWAGMTRALGRYEPELLATFLLGTTEKPGRMAAYCGGVSPEGVRALRALVPLAARGLCKLHDHWFDKLGRTGFALGLTQLTLEMLAESAFGDLPGQAIEKFMNAGLTKVGSCGT